MTAVRSEEATARRAGCATAEFDLDDHWRERGRGREGWNSAPALTRELSACFTATVGEALKQAGGVPDRVNTEFVAATWYGTSHVAEVMHEQLREAGPKWIDPEQFLYYSPHSMVSAAALAFGLGGASSTLMGPDAEFQALAHAVRRIRCGYADTVIVAEYEALTPFAATACPDGAGPPGRDGPPKGRVTALVLTSAGGTGPGVTVRRGLGDAEVERLAERHGTTVQAAAPGLLRSLAGGTAPVVVVSRTPRRCDAVVLA